MQKLFKLFILAISWAQLSSCAGEPKEVVVPADVLPKEKMVNVMIDMHLLEAALNLNYMTEAQLKESGKYEQVFSDHNVTEAAYNNSLKFYTDHPKLMLVIYEELLEELSRRQAELSEHQVSADEEELETSTSVDSLRAKTIFPKQRSK